MDLKKCWGVEKCLGGMPTNFVYGFEKKIGGGVGMRLMPKYFIDLKKCWGGVCGRMPKHFRDLEKMLVGGGVMPKYFTDLKNVGGGGGGVCQQIYGLEKCWGGYAKII